MLSSLWLRKRGMYTVLDTNILVSALLFRGRATGVYRGIVEARIVPCMSPSIFAEYRRVLAYRKFGLSDSQIAYLLKEEILPFFVMLEEPPAEAIWIPEDCADNKFVDMAAAIPDSVLVSGDSHILAHRAELPCRVQTLDEFLETLK